MFRREWRQQILVLGLMTTAVTIAVSGAAMVTNGVTPRAGQFGDASGLVRVDGTDSDAAARTVAAVRTRFGTIEVISHTRVEVPGSVQRLDLRRQSIGGPFAGPMLAVREGRVPDKEADIALTDGAASLMAASIGDRVEVGGVTRAVVGIVENPGDLSDEFVLAVPDDSATADQFIALIDLDARADVPPTEREESSGSTDERAVPFGVEGAPADDGSIQVVVFIVLTLVMALVALIAASGFIVVAQRRQRQLGLLAALGATSRHLRLAMTVNGAIVGAIAAGVGAFLGVVAWIAAAPGVETSIGHRVDRWALPWTLIVACSLLAVVAGAGSAWWPARGIARLPVMTALSRRPARPTAVHRSLLLSAVLIVAGVGGLWVAQPKGEDVRPWALIGGVLAVILGVVTLAPAAVRILNVPLGRVPVASRLALRELVRHQSRSAAALAATTLALGIAVSVIVVAQINVPRAGEGNLSDRQLLVHAVDDARTMTPNHQSDEEVARLDAAADEIAGAVGVASVLPLDLAINRTASTTEPVTVATPIVGPNDPGYRDRGFAFIATPEVLAGLGLGSMRVDSTIDLLTAIGGGATLLDFGVRGKGDPVESTRQRVTLPAFSSPPRSLVTESAMTRYRWTPIRSAWLIEVDDALTSEQITAAQRAAASVGLTIEVREGDDALATVRLVASIVGAVLALAIVAMTIGLLRGESAADVRTLTATGADVGARRMIGGTTACGLAVLGVVLGTAGAYLAVAAVYRSQLDRLVPVPWIELLSLAVGFPAVAFIGAWLMSGREPEAFVRQLTE